MSFNDLGKKSTEPHVDTPAQAEARAQAAVDLKAKADAKTAKNAARREKSQAPAAGAKPTHGSPTKA
jgi:hypothetical protein